MSTILITGASSGFGRACAEKFAVGGNKLILAARRQDRLESLSSKLSAQAEVHTMTLDVRQREAVTDQLAALPEAFRDVDILINNAGRSIRRSLKLTYNRFHDFERVMQLNYFSAIRLTMNLLPSMTQRKSGHIVNISSIAALGSGSPRFSSYTASKSALDAWSDSAALEYADCNISFSNIHMPLVRTKMIAATKSYQDVNTLSTHQAGKLISAAIIHRPGELNTMTGSIVRQLGIFAPKLNKLIFSTLYQITDDSEAAKSSAHQHTADEDKDIKATKAMDALQQLHLDKQTLESIANILQGYHT